MWQRVRQNPFQGPSRTSSAPYPRGNNIGQRDPSRDARIRRSDAWPYIAPAPYMPITTADSDAASRVPLAHPAF